MQTCWLSLGDSTPPAVSDQRLQWHVRGDKTDKSPSSGKWRRRWELARFTEAPPDYRTGEWKKTRIVEAR